MAIADLVARVPWPAGREMLLLMRVDRPIGTWLLLWPALWSLLAASHGKPDPMLFAVICVGAFVMRSAGCVANDLADRRFDAQVARTRERPLAAGRISPATALILLLVLLSMALGLLFFLNPLARKLAVAGAFLAVTYPLTKRILPIPQLYMGAAFAWGGVLAWAAAAGDLAVATWFLFLATLFWAAGYDTIYAMMDREDDRKIGIGSSALFFEKQNIPAIAILYGLSLLCLLAVGHLLDLSPLYYLSLMVAQGHMSYQLYRIRNDQREEFLTAFLSNKWVGFIVFVGLGLGW